MRPNYMSLNQVNTAKKVMSNISNIYDKDYGVKLKELEDLYHDITKMPSRIGLTDEENLKYDHNRLDYIVQAIEFIEKYYLSNGKSSNINLTKSQDEFRENLELFNFRRLMVKIAFTIFDLSSTIRDKYKHLLQPSPFTWTVFEHLGNLMKISQQDWGSLAIKNVSVEVAERLLNEINNNELIVEASIPKILREDIPKLKQLFNYIQCAEKNNIKDIRFEPVKLLAIKALTRRHRDTESLVNLLKIAKKIEHVADNPHVQATLKMWGKSESYYNIDNLESIKLYNFDLTTKIGKQALLRRLENIGELITGKNFSSFLTDLDSTIDWQIFIVIRDIISHQDEEDRKNKVGQLLQNQELLQAIFDEDLEELFNRLTNLVLVRNEMLPKFNKNNIEEFWQAIYLYENASHVVITKKEIEVRKRVSNEEAKFFIDALKANNVDINIQLKWLYIFNGNTEIPNKKELGDLLRSLPSKKSDKVLYDKCKKIADAATTKPKIDPEAREAKRKQEQELAKQKEEDLKSKFTGFKNLKKITDFFATPIEKDKELTPKLKVQAAIEALENIKEILENNNFTGLNFNFTSISDWNNTQTKQAAIEFFEKIIDNPQIHDAIEYNSAQLLQYLGSIHKFEIAKGSKFIQESYDSLRNLRNHVEHGNALLDKEEYETGKNPAVLPFLKQKLSPIMIGLIFNLLPLLKEIYNKLD